MTTELLKAAASEIRSLRRRNEILSPKVEVIETIGIIARGLDDHGTPMGEDLATYIDREVEKIEAVTARTQPIGPE